MKNKQKEIQKLIIEQRIKRLKIERSQRKHESLTQLVSSFSSSVAMMQSNSLQSQMAVAMNRNISDKEFLELSKDSQGRLTESINSLGKSMIKAADNIINN